MRLHHAVLLLALIVASCSDNTSTVVSSDAGGSNVPASCAPIGKSVACVGVGGCKGAQVCAKDGSYGNCDCGVAPLATCGAVGATAACFGVGACAGAQVCGADGAFGLCQCLPVTVMSTPITLTVTAPVEDAIWKGTVELKGTTTGPVSVVGVSVNGEPFVLATGTQSWRVSYDTSHLLNGTNTVVVAAQGAGQDVRTTVRVIIDNLDPVIGGWRVRPRYKSDRCTMTLLPSGAASDTCYLLIGPSGTWKRESVDTISINGRPFTATVSANGRVLTLAEPNGYNVFGYPLYGNTATFDLVQRIDPFYPTVNLDAGVDDGGYVNPYPIDDAGN